MFYYIKGNVAYKGENFVVVDVSGVGYKVYTSRLDITRADGFETFYTYTYVKEDAFDIYGFLSVEGLNMFEKLISINGVGPKAALSILSNLSANDLQTAIQTNNAKLITAAQGIGIKTAQRIILELKDNFSDRDVAVFSADVIPGSKNEAVSALIALGYSGQEARRAISSTDEKLSTEDTIKEALKVLMR